MNIPEQYKVTVKYFKKKKNTKITINGFKKTQSIQWAVEV